MRETIKSVPRALYGFHIGQRVRLNERGKQLRKRGQTYGIVVGFGNRGPVVRVRLSWTNTPHAFHHTFLEAAP